MKKLIVALSIMAVIAVLVSGGIFGYSQFKKINDGNGIQISINSDKGETSESSETTTEEDKQVNEEEQTQEVQSTEDNVTNEQSTEEENNESNNSNETEINRDNVFDYALAAINEVGDADLMKFQEPSYSDGVWTIDANNKSGSGSNTIKVYDDGWVQIYDGSGEIAHETKIEL